MTRIFQIRSICRFLYMSTMLGLLLMLLISPAFAAPIDGPQLQLLAESPFFTWNGEENIGDIFSIARSISVAAAAVVIAIGGIMMIVAIASGGMSDKDQNSTYQKGKAIVKYALIALIAIALLPLVFKLVLALFDHEAKDGIITPNGIKPWTPPTTPQ